MAFKPRFLTLLLFLVFFKVAKGHLPSQDLMYPADKVYAEKGLEIPDLSDDEIAIIGDERLSKSDYKKWLYAKVGMLPEMQDRYHMERYLVKLYAEVGMDPKDEMTIFRANLKTFNDFAKPFTNQDDWLNENRKLKQDDSKATNESEFQLRFQYNSNYIATLYLIAKWDDLHSLLFEDKGIPADALKVKCDDASVAQLIRLNNAYFIANRFSSIIEPRVRSDAFKEKRISLSAYDIEYMDWVYAHYSSSVLVENYLSMQLIERTAANEGIELNSKDYSKDFEASKGEYRRLLDNYNKKHKFPLEPYMPEPERLAFLSRESRIDVLGSKMIRRNQPIKAHELKKRFYDQYGYDGVRCKVHGIFKLVVRKKADAKTAKFADYLSDLEATWRAELNRIKERIETDEPQKFPEYALMENNKVSYQNNFGYWGILIDETKAELEGALAGLQLFEISPVVKTSKGLHLFYLAKEGEGQRYYHHITRQYPRIMPFDLDAYELRIAQVKRGFEDLVQRHANGADFEKLAEQHSDSFKKYGADLSDAYLKRYGYAFARELNRMSVGDLKTIAIERGMYLLKILDKQKVEFTDEIRDKLIADYSSEICDDAELNRLSKSLLYELNPYFK